MAGNRLAYGQSLHDPSLHDFLGGIMKPTAKEAAERYLARFGALAALAMITAILIYGH